MCLAQHRNFYSIKWQGFVLVGKICLSLPQEKRKSKKKGGGAGYYGRKTCDGLASDTVWVL